MTVINFQQAMEQAKSASFDPLPVGVYDLVCIESTPTESSTHKPMIRTKYQVETGPSAGKKVFNQYVFSADSDTALAIFFRHMSFHGLDATFFAANPAWEQVAAALVGRRVRVQLGIRQWQGVDRNDVQQVMPPGDTAMTPGTMAPAAMAPAPQVAPPQMQVAPPVLPGPQVAAPIAPAAAPVTAPVAAPVAPVAAPVTPPVVQPSIPGSPSVVTGEVPQAAPVAPPVTAPVAPPVAAPAAPVAPPVEQPVPVGVPAPAPEVPGIVATPVAGFTVLEQQPQPAAPVAPPVAPAPEVPEA